MKARDFKIPLTVDLLYLLGCLRWLAATDEEEDDDFDLGNLQG